MTNLPIPSSNQLPAAPQGDAPLPAPRPPAGRMSGGAPFTGPSAAPAKAASMAQTNGIPGAPPVESFGALLAQQMDGTGTPALVAPLSATAIDTKTTADSASPVSKGDQDKALAATGIPADPASALAAMLQLPQEIKTPVVKDTTNSTTAAVRTKAASHQPTANIYATQALAKPDPATADHKVVRSTSGLEVTSPAVLTNNLPGTPLPAQDATPLTASVAAAAVMPNMLAGNRLSDTRQTVATPLGSNGWADEFSQKISWMSTQQNQVAELHLNPPDLGPLDVVLKVSDNQATALFTSPHSAVRDAVENALPKLREILADNGITLGSTTISDQPPRDRDAERFMNQASGTAAQRGGFGGASESTGASPAITRTVPIRRHNGMVDTFA